MAWTQDWRSVPHGDTIPARMRERTLAGASSALSTALSSSSSSSSRRATTRPSRVSLAEDLPAGADAADGLSCAAPAGAASTARASGEGCWLGLAMDAR